MYLYPNTWNIHSGDFDIYRLCACFSQNDNKIWNIDNAEEWKIQKEGGDTVS